MSNTEEFIAALNNKLPGKDNDFSDGTTPSINTQGKKVRFVPNYSVNKTVKYKVICLIQSLK